MTPAQPWEVLTPAAGHFEPYLPWSPIVGAVTENLPRVNHTNVNIAPLASGTLWTEGNLIIPAGKLVSKITWLSGSTAAVTPTNQWMALIDAATLAVLSVTNDDGATLWDVNQLKTLSLVNPFRAAVDQRVYAGLCWVGTTPPSLRGFQGLGTSLVLAPAANGPSNAGLTNPASLPNPIAAPAGSGFFPWVTLS